MATPVDSRQYELAYHLHPDIEAGEVGARVQELEQIITQANGSVLLAREPKRKHLSFPLRNKHYSYFGQIDFSAPAESIEQIAAQLKLQNQLMRYLLITKAGEEKELRTLGSERTRPRLKTHDSSTPSREEADRAGKPKIEVKPEQLEKELEDVLEKI